MNSENSAVILSAIADMRSRLTLAESLIAYPPALSNPSVIGNPEAVPIVQALSDNCDAIEAALQADADGTSAANLIECVTRQQATLLYVAEEVAVASTSLKTVSDAINGAVPAFGKTDGGLALSGVARQLAAASELVKDELGKVDVNDEGQNE